MATPIPIAIHHHRHSTEVTASLPGVQVQDLRVSLTSHELTIEARCAGATRAVVVPLAPPVDERRATLRFAEGGLSLHLPLLPA